MKLKDSIFVVFDTETTGISPDHGHKVIEFAAIKFDYTGAAIDSYETLLNPMRKIPKVASDINNITDDMVSEQPRFSEIVEELNEFMSGSVLIGHNVGFDIKFINSELELCGYSKLTNQYIDTCSLARKSVIGLLNYKLITVAKHFNVELKNAHRAMGDVEATKDVFMALMDITKCETVTEVNNYRSQKAKEIDEKVGKYIEQIKQAMNEKRQIVIDYISASSNKPRKHDIIPLQIIENRGLLKGYNNGFNKELTYRLDRIKAIQITDKF